MCLSNKHFVLLLLFFLTTFLYPLWSADPATNLTICTAEQTKRETKFCRDNNYNWGLFLSNKSEGLFRNQENDFNKMSIVIVMKEFINENF